MSPEDDPRILPLLPLHKGVILPHMEVPLVIESPESKAALAAARKTDQTLIAVAKIKKGFAPVGTVVKVLKEGRTAQGQDAVVVKGLHRAVIGRGVPGSSDALWVSYEPKTDSEPPSAKAQELAKDLRVLVEAFVEEKGVPEVAEFLKDFDSPGALADASGYSPDLSVAQRIELLETLDVEERLRKALAWFKDIFAEQEVKSKIRSSVAEDMGKSQREYLLRRQMEAIQKELGELTGEKTLVEEYRAKIKKAGMSPEALKEAERELGRLERTSEQNPEHGWIRNYLDWITDLPWSSVTPDNLDLDQARKVLDEDHTGLEDVKKRILEFLAVRKLRKERGLGPVQDRGGGAILALVGPPGVGKTSLGESIARALGRKFVRVSLGGVADEAEIRGHRRTYVGALPGKIVRGLKEAGVKNPVFMLDEADKVGSSWRGDLSSALLEVLDPAQNHNFRDHFLDVPVDLSDVLFICTANVTDSIPGPLLDRMEVLRLEGYTQEEKTGIARRHLIPRQLARQGLREGEADLNDDGLSKLIADYTREAGVRNLEREIGALFRQVASRLAGKTLNPPVKIGAKDLREYLDREKFKPEAHERVRVPGVATGLSVTGYGGEVLYIEAGRVDEKKEGDELILTGQLGDVMKESARIALSYVRGHVRNSEGRFHLHVPSGAIPKDGPSAGVTMVAALASLLGNRPIRPWVGMTGEVTLRGKVLPVGGIKQKVLAAHRAGLKEVILPRQNEGDLDKVPESVKKEMKFHLVDEVHQVLELALTKARARAAA